MKPIPGKRILIVEDNPGDQLILSELLQMSEVSIGELVYCTKLEDAIVQLKENQIDIVLLDLTLPDSNGMDSFISIKPYTLNIPVIILSGLNNTDLALTAIGEGAQDYLVKDDFDERLLSKTIRYSIERKRNQEELRINNERYNLVSKATNDLVWDSNVLTGQVYRNAEQFLRITKLPVELKDGPISFWLSRVHPEDLFQITNALINFEQTIHADTFDVEYRFLRGDGNYIYLSDRGYAVKDENGKVIRIIGSTRDITERKTAEQALRKSEEQYRYLFNNNPASIIIWYLDDFSIGEVNDAAIAIYGYSRPELLQKKVLDFQTEAETSLIQDLAEKALSDESFRDTIIWRHKTRSGRIKHLQIAAHRVIYNDRPAILSLGIDVTEKIALERKLVEERIKKNKEITAAVINAQEQEREEIGLELHDNINQILASSRLYLGLAKAGGKLQSKYMSETDMLINCAIQEIRALSHALIPPFLEGNEFIESLDNIFKTTMEGSSLIIEKEIVGIGETPLSEKMQLTIYRIVQEQFNNILKYAKANTVTLKLMQEGPRITLSIKDDGQGANLGSKGDGVGLMNIRTRASLFNGEVAINTAPGKGFELMISFNCNDEMVIPTNKPAPKRARNKPWPTLKM